MYRLLLISLLACGLFSCSDSGKHPDVSGIPVKLDIERFDEDFFHIDTSNIAPGLQQLAVKYPVFYPLFMQEILGVSASDTSINTLMVTRHFISGYLPVYDSIYGMYRNTDGLKKDLEQAFRYVRYYFPAYPAGKLVMFLGPFDAPGVATIPGGVAVGLQQFAGKDFFVYQSSPGQEMFPLYISRRFAPEYITSGCMKAVINDLFPDKSGDKALIDQMVEKGKQWYLLDKFLPETPDSLKTGYTQNQLNWCQANEGLIWSYIYKNEDLRSFNPVVIQTYIGDAPFTQGFSQENSPGNIGQWIGWQIVKAYAAKNPDIKPEELMRTAPATIIDEAKYKPK